MIEKEKAIVPKKENLPSTIDLESMEGQGNEYVTARDTKLPIIKLLYASSPVLNDRDPRFDESAKHLEEYGKAKQDF